VFCPQCGRALQGWEQYCPACGKLLAAPAAPPPAAPPAAPRDPALAATLLLAGAVLSIAMPGLFALMFLGVLGSLAHLAGPSAAFPVGVLTFLAAVFLVLGVLWAAVGLWARQLVVQGERQRGATAALVAGAIGVFTGNVIGGVLYIAAGILAHGP
jgi:hypothetical protein